MNLIQPGDSAADNEYLQLAQSHKYDSSKIATIAELRPGLFALYQHANLIYVGDDWFELLSYYQARPAYVPRPRSPRSESRKSCGKISAAEKAANTAKLLASMKGASNV